MQMGTQRGWNSFSLVASHAHGTRTTYLVAAKGAQGTGLQYAAGKCLPRITTTTPRQGCTHTNYDYCSDTLYTPSPTPCHTVDAV